MNAKGVISALLRPAAGYLLGLGFSILAFAPGLQASTDPVPSTGSLGAEAAALGGAQVSSPGSSQVLFVNPAALGQVRWLEFGAGCGQEEANGLRDAYTSAALPLFGQVTGGAGLLQDAFPRGPQVETDIAYATLAFPLSRDHQLLAGVNAKYFFHQDTLSAGSFSPSSGGGVDLGFLYKLLSDPEGQNLQLGLSACDPQTVLKNDAYDIQLPVVVRAGAWWRLDGATALTAEYDSQSASAPGYDSFQVIRAGGEHRVDFAFLDALALRLGYFQRLDQTGTATGGFGAVYGDWQVDYALQIPLGHHNAFHELSVSWGPQRRTRSKEAPVEDALAVKPKPTATPKPQDKLFSALDTAAEVEEERRKPVEVTPTPTPAVRAKPQIRVAGDVEPVDDSAAVYHTAVPQSPVDQENSAVTPELDMPGSFSGYLSGLKQGQDNFKIVNQDVRLLVVVNPFSPNNDGRQDKTIFVGRIESERLRMSHWAINVIQSDRVYRTFKGGSRLPHNLEWDGTDERGRVLPDGTYDVLLRIFDEAGLEAAGVTQPVVIRTVLIPIKISAPATVTLTGDKEQDQPVAMAIPKIPHSSNWHFAILDPNRRRVFERKGSGEVPEKISWPLHAGGRVASSGKYRVRLDYFDEVGLKGAAETEFKVGYAAFSVELKAAPLLFKPGQNAGEGVTFSPDLQGDLKISRWSIALLEEKSDRLWRRLEGEGQPPAAILWDGKDASGNPVPGGKMFRAVLTAVSAVGTEEHAETPLLQSDLGDYTGKQALAMNLTRVSFEAESAALTDSGIKNLQAAANVLHQNKTDFILRIMGYCDLKEAKDKVVELSRQRAQAVADYLIKTANIPAEKIQCAGYGNEKPLSTDSSEIEQAKNRRVEILLFAK
jgi:outer membrane protein OmpA-like peptidoglycan-associated protein